MVFGYIKKSVEWWGERRVTDSVWPCVILHSMQGAVPTLLFVTEKVLRMEESHSFILNPVSGILQPAVIFVFGLQHCKEERKVDALEWQLYDSR